MALVSPSDSDEQWLVDRLILRLRQHHGECIYEVGVAEHSDEQGMSINESINRNNRTLARRPRRVGDDYADDRSTL